MADETTSMIPGESEVAANAAMRLFNPNNNVPSIQEYQNRLGEVSKMVQNAEVYQQPDYGVLGTIGKALYETTKLGRIALAPVYMPEEIKQQNIERQRQNIPLQESGVGLLRQAALLPSELDFMNRRAQRDTMETEAMQESLSQQYIDRTYRNQIKNYDDATTQYLLNNPKLAASAKNGGIDLQKLQAAIGVSKPARDLVDFQTTISLYKDAKTGNIVAQRALQRQLTDNNISIINKDGIDYIQAPGSKNMLEINDRNIAIVDDLLKTQAATALKYETGIASARESISGRTFAELDDITKKMYPDMKPEERGKYVSGWIKNRNYSMQDQYIFTADRILDDIKNQNLPELERQVKFGQLMQIAEKLGIQHFSDPETGKVLIEQEPGKYIGLEDYQKYLKSQDVISTDIVTADRQFAARQEQEKAIEQQVYAGKQIMNTAGVSVPDDKTANAMASVIYNNLKVAQEGLNSGIAPKIIEKDMMDDFKRKGFNDEQANKIIDATISPMVLQQDLINLQSELSKTRQNVNATARQLSKNKNLPEVNKFGTNEAVQMFRQINPVQALNSSVNYLSNLSGLGNLIPNPETITYENQTDKITSLKKQYEEKFKKLQQSPSYRLLNSGAR